MNDTDFHEEDEPVEEVQKRFEEGEKGKTGYVDLELDLDNETIVILALYAHERDITINAAVNEVLATELKKYKQDEV